MSKINKNNNSLSHRLNLDILNLDNASIKNIEQKKTNSTINIRIILFRKFPNYFPFGSGQQGLADREPLPRKDSHRAGIITKRRIKLHDILLLSRFPLIK